MAFPKPSASRKQLWALCSIQKAPSCWGKVPREEECCHRLTLHQELALQGQFCPVRLSAGSHQPVHGFSWLTAQAKCAAQPVKVLPGVLTASKCDGCLRLLWMWWHPPLAQ